MHIKVLHTHTHPCHNKRPGHCAHLCIVYGGIQGMDVITFLKPEPNSWMTVTRDRMDGGQRECGGETERAEDLPDLREKVGTW